MKFDFVKWNNGEWAVQHPDTIALGFGKTKFQAVKDLEAWVDRKLSFK